MTWWMWVLAVYGVLFVLVCVWAVCMAIVAGEADRVIERERRRRS
jgi:hypothetical protein